MGEDGRIARVGPTARQPPDADTDGAAVVELGDAILLPGLVNVHAHPELTALRGTSEGLPFPAWIERLIHLKYEVLRADEIAAATRWGVSEAAAAGVTTLAMIDDAGFGAPALGDRSLRGLCYIELFGPDPARAHEALARCRDRIAAIDPLPDERIRIGLSPHSPYTVSAPLLEAAVSWAREVGMPVSMHVAESCYEDEFVRHGRGPLADRLRRRGIAVAATGMSPIEWLAEHGALGVGSLLAHCVHLSASDVARVAETGAAVAHCPTSNVKLGSGVAPIEMLLKAGVPVGIGSDSVVSNNRIDLFAEARTGALLQAADRGDPNWCDPALWIRMLTLGGAEALGLEEETGSLQPGKWADLAVVDLGAPHLVPTGDPYAALVFAATASDVSRTVVAGETVYERSAVGELFSQQDRRLLTEASERVRRS